MAKKASSKSEKTLTPERPHLSSLSRLQSARNFRPNKLTAVLAIVLVILGLAYYKKSWFVAAVVNGQPISAIELNNRVNSAYRAKVLDNMVNDKILDQEAAKKGVVIGQDKIDQKVSEIETSYGGTSVFDSLLQQQGMTREDFVARVKVQLLAEELYKDEVNPKPEEIDKFMKDNANSPEATDPAKFRAAAENELKQQKLSDVFAQKFQDLKKNASVQIF